MGHRTVRSSVQVRARRRAIADWLTIIIFGLFFAAIIGFAALSIWARATWSCDRLGWLPSSETPNRCLQVTIHQDGGHR